MNPSCSSEKVRLPVTDCAVEERTSLVVECERERADSLGFSVPIVPELLCLHLSPLCQCWAV